MGLRIGIDWSGTPATVAQSFQGPFLVVAACCVSDEDLAQIVEHLAGVRRQFRLHDRFVFHFSACRDTYRQAVLHGMDALPVTTFVRATDKRQWDRAYLASHRTGLEREVDAVAGLLGTAPGHPAAGATILIDAPPTEAKLIAAMRKRLSGDARALGIPPPARVKPIPDSHQDGALIQLADMVAGAVRSSLEQGRQPAVPGRGSLV